MKQIYLYVNIFTKKKEMKRIIGVIFNKEIKKPLIDKSFF
jgi:hypothetical protein